MEHQLIILGSGPAGYTSAIYAARANLKPTLITGLEVGGQLTTTTEVENWPGDFEDLQGPDLMVRMKKHAEKYNVNIIHDHIKSVDFQTKPLILNGQKDSYKSESLSKHHKTMGGSKDSEVYEFIVIPRFKPLELSKVIEVTCTIE